MWDRCEERGTGCSFCQIWKRQNVKYPPYGLRALARAKSLPVPVLVLRRERQGLLSVGAAIPQKAALQGSASPPVAADAQGLTGKNRQQEPAIVGAVLGWAGSVQYNYRHIDMPP